MVLLKILQNSQENTRVKLCKTVKKIWKTPKLRKPTSETLTLCAYIFFLFSCLVCVKGRSSLDVLYKLDVFKFFAKFTGKLLCQSLFFNKVAVLSLKLYLKKDSGTGVFL